MSTPISTRSAIAAAASAAADAADAAATSTTTTSRPPVRRAAAIADLQLHAQLHGGSSSQATISVDRASIPPASQDDDSGAAAAAAAAATVLAKKGRKRAATEDSASASKRARYSDGSTLPLETPPSSGGGAAGANKSTEVVPSPRLITLCSKNPAPLSQQITDCYNTFVQEIHKFSDRETKNLSFLGGEVSVGDIVAYQIGMGKLLLAWYETGVVRRKNPQIPGEGFESWNEKGLASHLYSKWRLDGGAIQEAVFHAVTSMILGIVEKEHDRGYLDLAGRWTWCSSAAHPQKRVGASWPLSQWVKICTTLPCVQATKVLQQHRK